MNRTCKIQERGNGLPGPRDLPVYIAGDDGELYEVTRLVGGIQTGRSAGAGNYVHADVTLASWEDCPEGEEFPALAVLDEVISPSEQAAYAADCRYDEERDDRLTGDGC